MGLHFHHFTLELYGCLFSLLKDRALVLYQRCITPLIMKYYVMKFNVFLCIALSSLGNIIDHTIFYCMLTLCLFSQ